MYKVAYNACYGGFSLSREASEYLRDVYGVDINPNFGFLHNTERHDPRLIETIEKFGDSVSGSCAEIKIKVITSPVYRIDEYDGYETVETPENLEWVIIQENENV